MESVDNQPLKHCGSQNVIIRVHLCMFKSALNIRHNKMIHMLAAVTKVVDTRMASLVVQADRALCNKPCCLQLNIIADMVVPSDPLANVGHILNRVAH